MHASESGGQAYRNFVFCACAVQFSWTGERCFWGISSNGGEAFVVDTCQRDRRGSMLHRCFCSSAMEFSRCGGARGRGFRWNATLGGNMPEGQEGNLAEPFSCALPPMNFPGPGGGVLWQISTIGGGAFGICMPACREGERTEPFSFALAPFNFSGAEGR